MIQEFHKPKTVDEAIALKKEFKDKAFFIAGGAEINNLGFPFKPTHLISVEDLGFNQIEKDQQGLKFGTNVTVQKLVEDQSVPEFIKTSALRLVNRNIRNIATVGGHIASNKSCSDLIPILVALKAELEIVTDVKSEKVLLEDYIGSEQKDLILQVKIPQENLEKKVKTANFRRSANDISILNAAVSYMIEKDVLKDLVVVAGGVAKHVVRLNKIESKLEGKKLPDQDALAQLVSAHVDPITDIRGSAEFKKYEIGVLIAKTMCEVCGS